MIDDSKITEALGRTLEDERPGTRARMFLPAKRPRGRFPLLALVAAGLLLLLISSLTVPVVARAMGEVPLLGESYRKFLEGTGLEIAYKSGLVTELNRSVTNGEVTFTILSAYSDATQSLVAFQYTSEDPDALEALWEAKGSALFPRVEVSSLFRSYDFSGHMRYIQEEGVIYGLMSSNPLPWHLFGRTLTAEIPSLGLSLTFPLQTVSSYLNDRVKINKTIAFEGLELAIEEVVFSPSATQVVYSYTNQGRVVEHKAWNMQLRSPEGILYQSLTGSRSSRFNRGQGVMNFLPLDQVTLLFTGWNATVDVGEEVSLQEGASISTREGEVTIRELGWEQGQVSFTLAWSGTGKLTKAGATLRDASGVQGAIADAVQTDQGLRVTMEHSQLQGEVTLNLDVVEISIEEEIEVATVSRGK